MNKMIIIFLGGFLMRLKIHFTPKLPLWIQVHLAIIQPCNYESFAKVRHQQDTNINRGKPSLLYTNFARRIHARLY